MLRYETIVEADALSFYKQDILALFKTCFSKELSQDDWEWLYIKNPTGPAIVTICFDGKRLIGHYAVIPIPLQRGSETIDGCLSLTTMVNKAYRKRGIFVDAANMVYDRAVQMGFKVVIGFPNDNSAQTFRKSLGWQISDNDYVASLTKEQLSKNPALEFYLNGNDRLSLSLDNIEYRSWRLSRRGFHYYDQGRLITKDFQTKRDIVYLGRDFSSLLEEKIQYNILIDASITEFRAFELFKYRFGFRVLSKSFNTTEFKKDLLMSDVF